MSFFNNSTAYVYTFDAATGALAAELMRVPGGGHCAARARSEMGSPHDRVLPTLGKDTQGLIEEVIIRRGEIVYFVERKAHADGAIGSEGSGCANESESTNGGAAARGETGRSRAVRRAMREVREVELMARRLEAALMEDDGEEGVNTGLWAAAEAESDEDEDDESDEDESLWGGYDESELEESEDDEDDNEDDNEDDDEVVFGLVEKWEEVLCGVKGSREVAIFGRNEDEADHMDVDGIKRTREETAIETTASTIKDDNKPIEDDREPIEYDNKFTEDNSKPFEEWTRPEDWDRPICTMPSTDFDLFGFRPETMTETTRTDEDASADHGWSADRGADAPRTRTVVDLDHSADCRTVADHRADAPRTRTVVDLDRSADSGLSADHRADAPRTRTVVDLDHSADCRTVADQRTRTDAGRSADARTGTRAEAKDLTIHRTRTDARPMVPMRTKAARILTHRMDPTPRTTTEPAPRVNLVQVSAVAKANMTGPRTEDTSGRSKKRKADDEDVDTDKVPEALARTRTLVGLKFKKIKTCHSILKTGKSKVMSVVASAVAAMTAGTTAGKTQTVGAGVDTVVQGQVRPRVDMKSGKKIQRCFDGDQKPSPRKIDGLGGRKRKNDDKEEGELSDDGIPQAKRLKMTQVARTFGQGTRERGAQRRWIDERQTTTTQAQRRPQRVQFGR